MFFKFLLLAVFITSIAAKDRLSVNECLNHNQAIESNNGCFQLIMQHDGNLVLYRRRTGKALWSTGTPRSCTNRVCMQGDGNFVAYDCHNIATWASGTMNNEGSTVTMQNDGNVVLYAWNSNRPVWASGTVTNC